jgi:hypothetical protein
MSEIEKVINLLISENEAFISLVGVQASIEMRKNNAIAISALREKAERMSGCEYCADREDLAFGHDSMKRVGSIYIDGNLLVADLYSESMAVAVCYCPMCGKSLKEDANER